VGCAFPGTSGGLLRTSAASRRVVRGSQQHLLFLSKGTDVRCSVIGGPQGRFQLKRRRIRATDRKPDAGRAQDGKSLEERYRGGAGDQQLVARSINSGVTLERG
jgi:hypothetical protein